MSQNLEILYIDNDLAIINKPTRIAVHASRITQENEQFLVDQLREQLNQPIYLIHRLDRATSGCILVAFNQSAASDLGQQLMDNRIQKDYLAVCRGWTDDFFEIDYPLDGGPDKPVKKSAITVFQNLQRGELNVPSSKFSTSRYSLLRCQPKTGRFRQIRRHLKHAFHHLIGDTSHGDGHHNRIFRELNIDRMLLHAEQLRFTHPTSQQLLSIKAPLDRQFQNVLTLFNWDVY